MTVTIALLNLKGGVGKTSACFHLGGMLAGAGRRVLLVDLDPQASLTQGFFGPRATRELPAARTAAALYDERGTPAAESLVVPTGVSSLDLLPGSPHLGRANMTPPGGWGRLEGTLRDALAEVSGRHDVVLIDCPPNLYLCSWSAMVAADAVCVPVQPEDFGSQGLLPVQQAIGAIRGGPNPGLRLAGYLLTMVDRRLTVHASYEGWLREEYGDAVFAHSIPRAKDFVEAVASRVPVGDYRPRSAAARATAAVGEELLARVGGRGAAAARGDGRAA